jgi:3-hydroxyethyl bacteriochlorophyllide a dehydrogenase
VAGLGHELPDLIVGHGALGRLMARICVAAGGAPTVWETNPDRREADAYAVIDPEADERRDYRCILDASGDADLIDALIGRVGRGGEVVLAGFYPGRVSFAFAPAFMREARLRIAAEWTPADLAATRELVEAGILSLAGLITHERPAREAPAAYAQAFDDPSCLKMVLDWEEIA